MSDSCQNATRSLSDSCWTLAGFLLDSCQILAGLLSDPCWTPVRSLLDSCQILAGTMPDSVSQPHLVSLRARLFDWFGCCSAPEDNEACSEADNSQPQVYSDNRRCAQANTDVREQIRVHTGEYGCMQTNAGECKSTRMQST